MEYGLTMETTNIHFTMMPCTSLNGHPSVFEDEHTVCEWLVHYSLGTFVIGFGGAEIILSVGRC